MTEKYPDVCHLVLALLTRPMPSRTDFPSSASPPAKSLIDMLNADSITSFTMDAEIVAVDKDTGAYRTFQDLSNRAKKDVRVEDIKVIVGVYAFDLMSLNDTVSSAIPYNANKTSRYSILHSHIGDTCYVRSSHLSQTPPTQHLLDSITSNHSTRQHVQIPKRKSKYSLKRSSSRNARV
jgi:ATP-dependent DNA ligase